MVEVCGNQRKFVVAENAFELGAIGSIADDLVELLKGCRTSGMECQINN